VSNTLEQLRRCSVAVDLGSSRTRVYIKQAGLVVDEPSVVAVESFSGALIAVGTAAEQMAGRTPRHIDIVRPVCNGAVVDIEMAQRMLRAMVGSAARRGWLRRGPMLRAAVTIPQGADPLARRAALETLTGVGARKVELVDAPTAAGIGCGLPVEEPEATMVLVCGTTTIQVAVLSLGSVVSAATVPMGGDSVHNAVVQHLRYRHRLLLPGRAVHALRLAMSDAGEEPWADEETTAARTSTSTSTETGTGAGTGAGSGTGSGGEHGSGAGPGLTELSGRDVATGKVRSIHIDPQDVRAAVQAQLTGLSDTIRAVLHGCPPDLVADLALRGMTLTGGSAVMPGLDERLRRSTGMSVHIAEEPALCAINGLAAMLEGRVEQPASETEELPQAEEAPRAAEAPQTEEAPQTR